ncbi:hypothetical protein BDV98DRAFT_654303 [Pterulicium gracile]|uniref:DUF7082 domain-containing protein n=1 Tax=Pterulicium gracile TaxID=1884261 RepID=A0A5C3QSA2_9AGAR|nr:hypothetical protein BDV98DRAFT_654303 [Pterula gracilis]
MDSLPCTDPVIPLHDLEIDGLPHFIQVLSLEPQEGEHGVPISVRIDFSHDSLPLAYVRLLVGDYPVPTNVKEILDEHGGSSGRWQLDASAPPMSVVGPTNASNQVQIIVEALDDQNTVIESARCGHFTYWVSQDAFSFPLKMPLQANSTGDLPQAPNRVTRRRALTTPSSTAHPGITSARTVIQRRSRANSNARYSTVSPGPESSSDRLHTPVLELVTPLSSITSGWSQEELSSQRRLVRFHKVLQGIRLIVSCEPVSQEYYDSGPSDFAHLPAVISCIYRAETNAYYVTSVDIIYLLERLVEEEFPVEEKNRIRRNLEGLRPTTVSKHKNGQEMFFTMIMDFPDPKPRNIEKDLKVFEWSLLGQALEKIISKYSVHAPPVPSGPVPVSALGGIPQSRTPIMSRPSPDASVADLTLGMNVNMFSAAKSEEIDGIDTPQLYLNDMQYGGNSLHIPRPDMWSRRPSSDSASASGSSGPNTAQWGNLQEQQQNHFDSITTGLNDHYVLSNYTNHEGYPSNYDPFPMNYTLMDKGTHEEISALLLQPVGSALGEDDSTSPVVAPDGSITAYA